MRSHRSICDFSGVLLLRASAPQEGPRKCSETFPVSIRNASRHIPGTRPETSRIMPENYLEISLNISQKFPRRCPRKERPQKQNPKLLAQGVAGIYLI